MKKGIKFNVKHINRHFYSGTHIPKTYTHYIQWLIFAEKGNRKIERFILLFYYNLNSVVKNGSQVGKSVFLIFIFTFYLRQKKIALRLALPSSFNARHYVTGVYSRIFLFANVELVILKLNASTMGNLFAASKKSVRALG